MNKQKSFTLIELLVVIVIIGILAGVIMISTSSSIDKANIAKVKVFEESVANNLAANMVSRWKLDQINYPAANQTPDVWGSNTGTLYGTNGLPQLRPSSECVSDGCLLFDGVDDYMSMNSNSQGLNNGSSFTLTIWVNSQNTQTCASGQYVLNISKGGGGLSASGSWNAMWHTCGNFFLYLRKPDNSTYVGVSTTSVSMRNWHNISFTFSTETESARIYIDGTDRTLTPGIGISSMYPNSQNIAVIHPTYPYYFKGLIDDMRIYDTSLSSSQIKQNYIAGLDSLLSKGSISKEDYNQRINELAYDNYE
ncbi:MAG: prepilin-type N-terminal cleavage/methylation domain-containing protein [Bacteroidales bacterium]|nr:prepilin-type N-terminal cleavage/methylation domain-containing protein [Bacteroidales bacterium]